MNLNCRMCAMVGGLLFAIILALASPDYSQGAINGSHYANQWRPIVFGNVTSADTLESIERTEVHSIIKFFVIVESTRASGNMAATDTVQVKLTESCDDTLFTNVSESDETLTYTSEGQKTITYDFFNGAKYVRLEIPNMAAADSIRVRVKAFISPRER